MMKAMISQPMAGKTDGEIAETRERAKAKLEEMGYEFVNTLFTDEWYSNEAMEKRGVVQVPLCYLAKSLENMSLCHAAYFAKGWEDARGCRIEHDAAVAYGLEDAIAGWNARAIDRDALLKVANECERADVDGVTDWAERIRKAVG